VRLEESLSRDSAANGVGLLSSVRVYDAVVFHRRGLSSAGDQCYIISFETRSSKKLTVAVGSVDRAIAQRMIDEWEIIE